MKKALKIIGIVIAILGVGAFVGIKFILQGMDQVKLQYDNEVISELKRELDFTAFDEDMSTMDSDKIKALEGKILNKSIEELQREINTGKLSCEDLVLFYVDRIKKNDSNYNTVIQLNSKVLEQAKALDEKIKNNEELGELFGVVILIKDNISDKDMNTASGAYALRDLTTSRDSFIVEKLKEEDAIILGKANLSEWSNFMSMPSSSGFSVLGGQTKNAYGTFDVGGSSSGSSSSVALDFATVSLGSETAGSLIFPAGQNSVVAIKPTLGLMSRDLIIPISEAQDTAGVIGRNVSDVYKVFKSTVVADPNDPLSINVENFDMDKLNQPLDKDYLKGKVIGLLDDGNPNNGGMKKELESLGATVVDVNIDAGDVDMMTVLNYGIVNDVEVFLNNPAVNTEFKSLKDIVEYNSQDPDKRKPFDDKLHQDALKQVITKGEYEKIVEDNKIKTQSAIDGVLKEKNLDAIASFSNTLSGIYAPASYPAVTVPAGYRESGEPFGVTFVGSLNDDWKLLNIAYSYEQGTEHRVAPTVK